MSNIIEEAFNGEEQGVSDTIVHLKAFRRGKERVTRNYVIVLRARLVDMARKEAN